MYLQCSQTILNAIRLAYAHKSTSLDTNSGPLLSPYRARDPVLLGGPAPKCVPHHTRYICGVPPKAPIPQTSSSTCKMSTPKSPTCGSPPRHSSRPHAVQRIGNLLLAKQRLIHAKTSSPYRGILTRFFARCLVRFMGKNTTMASGTGGRLFKD